MTPEQKARVNIDTLLRQAGWHVCGMDRATICAIQRLRGMRKARAKISARTHQ